MFSNLFLLCFVMAVGIFAVIAALMAYIVAYMHD